MRAFFGVLWRGLDGLRRILHLILLLVIFGFIVGALSPSIPSLPAKAALVIAPQGEIVEQLSGDPIDRAIAEARGLGESETLLRDLTDSIRNAATDDRIQALVLDLDAMTGGGQPTLDELARAIDEFRNSDKKVIAHGIAMLQGQYYVAAHADEIYLDPFGLLVLEGYDRYRTYFRDALEKIGVDINLFRVGAYKSAAEPYVRQDMSSEDREESVAYLTSLWSSYQDAVGRARGLPAADIARYADTYPDAVVAASGDAPLVALNAKLITGILDATAVGQRVIELVGEDETTGSFQQVSLKDYRRVMRATESLKTESGPRVAVLVASGEILDGRQPAGMIGGESTAELVRKARLDDDIKALVLRIDSPGGSVIASEQIYREVKAFRESGRPVVVSMGDLAASGGYYIAAPADQIWASPATLTGSIGIFGVFPTVNRGLDKLGIAVDGVGTTPLSGEFRLDRPLGPAASKLFQATIERGYVEFLGRVADGRERPAEELDAVAQGRVWAGVDAKRVGLVDELGSFKQAVDAAARLAGLDDQDYMLDYIEPEMSWTQELLTSIEVRLLSSVARLVPATAGLWSVAGIISPATTPLQRELARWQRLKAPNHLYAYCFCGIE